MRRGFSNNKLALFGFLTLGLCTGARLIAAETPFIIGIGVHLHGVTGTDDGRIIESLTQLGATSVRLDVLWSNIEKDPGRFQVPPRVENFVDRCVKSRLAPLLVLGYGNRFYDSGAKPLSPTALDAYIKYADFVVEHFKGRVRLYEVWNEWNNGGGDTKPGTPADYLKLLSATYPSIKAIDSSITVLGGGISPGGVMSGFLDQLIDGGLANMCDGVSFHPYNWMNNESRGNNPDSWSRVMYRTEVHLHKLKGYNFPVYITEMGWPTHSGPQSTSPETVAAYVQQTFLLAKATPYIKGLWWYDLADDGPNANDPESNFGLLRYDFTPKPAALALKSIKDVLLAGSVTETKSADPELKVLQIKLKDGKTATAVWKIGTGTKAIRLAPSSPQSAGQNGNIVATPKPTIVVGEPVTVQSRE